MPLNIKDAETHELARRLAKLTGESMTKAVKGAVAEKLARVEKARGRTTLADALDHIALHCAGLPKTDARTADEIIGYDDSGLPT